LTEVDVAEATGDLEKEAFRAMNAVVEPLVRAGFAGPLFTPFGLIVLETLGRETQEIRRTPLLATSCGQLTVVATFRAGRSQWVKNLALQTSADWWKNGRRVTGRPVVFAEAAPWPDETGIPAALAPFVEAWRPLVAAGWAIAVLVSADAQA
jgi:hypothetical protein